MYKEFFHLHESPFSITADPDFYFSSPKHEEAISHMVYGIQHRKGILVISGEIGTGKTTLCRMLLNKLDNNVKTALILNPSFSDLQLLNIILKDLGITGKFRNKFDLIEALNNFLMEETRKNHNVVLIVDEAQNLKPKQLEQIRMLSNLETEKEKLLQIILVGQPELNTILNLSELTQLNQRIFVRYHLTPLAKTDISDYIYHRIKIASKQNTKKIIFSTKAIDTIYELSKGTPRLVNILCDRALLSGFVAASFDIDENMVQNSAEEVFIK
ncbi:MAG: AAA family ATPase [Candidatus Omnitrophica bacterium]|nr:AAA family ATPase [Candidatus Omnitrophota bacterium]